MVDVTILDLDRTLTRRGTWSPFLLHAARNEEPWRLLLVPLVLACMVGYRLGLMSRKTLKQRMQRLMMGRSMRRWRVAALVASFADQVVQRGLHAEVLPLIAIERAAGRTLILATAAHRVYAEAIAERLGIHNVVATESLWRGDRLLPVILGENCYGAAKIAAILAHLDRIGLPRGNVRLRVYSDDGSDLPCFDAADECFVVNPSRKLAELAQARNWTMLRFT